MPRRNHSHRRGRHLPEQSDPPAGQHARCVHDHDPETAAHHCPADLATERDRQPTSTGHVEKCAAPRGVGHQATAQAGETRVHQLDALGHAAGTLRGTFFCMTEDARRSTPPVHEFGLELAWTSLNMMAKASRGLGPDRVLNGRRRIFAPSASW